MLQLQTDGGAPLNVGDKVTTFRGETMTLVGWLAPHKPSSTGRVIVTAEGSDHDEQYFPSVVGAKFVEVDL